MASFQITLSGDEKELLVQMLETELGETRVEVHHTHTPAYRDKVQSREVAVRALLAKLSTADQDAPDREAAPIREHAL
jgi:hypothetical protein